MKKMMIALAGAVSVLLLASCQKEIEIDGDVSLENNGGGYRMTVLGTGSYVEAEYDDAAEKWVAKDGAQPVALAANEGWIGWDDQRNTNQKTYEINTWYNGKLPEKSKKLELKGMFPREYYLKEYKGKFYMPDVGLGNEVTVTGSPKDKKFTVEMKDRYIEEIIEEGERYNYIVAKNVLVTFSLIFERD